MSKEKRYYFDECSEDIYDGKIDDYPYTRTICETLNRQDQKIADLEAKLVEKDGEIERLKQDYDEIYEDVYFRLKEDFELNNHCGECIRYYTEELNKQLIEQLEKVKENIKKCNYKDFGIMYQSDAIQQLNNQIKQLKEKK